jgi:hypothetical protein
LVCLISCVRFDEASFGRGPAALICRKLHREKDARVANISRDAKKTAAQKGGRFESFIVSRRSKTSLAGLAATYSSKP